MTLIMSTAGTTGVNWEKIDVRQYIKHSIKDVIVLIQRHDANISNFHISLKGKLDRIEQQHTDLHIVLKRIEKLLERINSFHTKALQELERHDDCECNHD